jgi:hypothetical protein
LDKNRYYKTLYLLIPLIFISSQPMFYNQLLFWVPQGREILAQWSLTPKLDHIIVPEQVYVHFSWLPSIIYYWLYSLGNVQLIAIFHRMILGLSLLFIAHFHMKKWEWNKSQLIFSLLGPPLEKWTLS